jgi:hypothetical protein
MDLICRGDQVRRSGAGCGKRSDGLRADIETDQGKGSGRVMRGTTDKNRERAKKLNEDAQALFRWEAGLKADERPHKSLSFH